MNPRLAVLAVIFLVTACQTDPPPLPGRGILQGSDWIKGRTRTSLVTGGKPVVIENTGPHELRIGSGADAVLLAPGATYETNGADTEVFNPAGQEARILLHAPEPSQAVDVLMQNGGEERRTRAIHRGGATHVHAVKMKAIEPEEEDGDGN